MPSPYLTSVIFGVPAGRLEAAVAGLPVESDLKCDDNIFDRTSWLPSPPVSRFRKVQRTHPSNPIWHEKIPSLVESVSLPCILRKKQVLAACPGAKSNRSSCACVLLRIDNCYDAVGHAFSYHAFAVSHQAIFPLSFLAPALSVPLSARKAEVEGA